MRLSQCSWLHEDELHAAGSRIVAGVDEVGRGALCGPVVACAVVLARDFDVSGIDDSKALSRPVREALAERIRHGAVAWALGRAEAEEIDRINILRATHLAMRRAIEGLCLAPDMVLVDGRPAEMGHPQRALVGGDRLSVSIAAASIVAKVARDAWMREYDILHPGYGLARNVGYASQEHRDALQRLGPTLIHRRSFGLDQRRLF